MTPCLGQWKSSGDAFYSESAMIRTSLGNLIILYLLASIGVIFIVWVIGEIVRRRRQQASTRHIILCSICGNTYRDTSGEKISSCPRCGSLNERGKVREI